jgi:2-polyprenyl-6-methoxyphenol hydroxylase-like FAD-dependent oxidoreductase
MNTSSSSKTRRAEIAGAGIAGLATAIALAQRGWAVRIHERAPVLRDSGAGIYLWENALRVLEALGASSAVEGGHRAYAFETRDENNAVTSCIRWDSPTAPRLLTVTRERLHRAMVDAAIAAGVKILTRSEAVDADPTGTLTLADGNRISADLIVVADGVHSQIRERLALTKRHRVLPDGCIRLMIVVSNEESHAEDGKKYIEWYAGSRRFLHTPCGGNEVYLALVAMDSDTDAKALPVRKETWKKSFPHLAPLIDRIDDQGRWDRFEVVRLKRWSKGRVALVGDAAHAQPPNLGQGGACAMMMGLALAAHLDRAASIEAGLSSWEESERELIEHTQTSSWLYGVVANWPRFAREPAFALIGHTKFSMRRMRVASHKPTGTC